MTTVVHPVPKVLKRAIRELREEIETRAEALPPSQQMLADWRVRLGEQFNSARTLRGPARREWHMLARGVEGLLGAVDEASQVFSPYRTTDRVDSGTAVIDLTSPRRMLAGAIRDAVRQRSVAILPQASLTDVEASELLPRQALRLSDELVVAASEPLGDTVERAASLAPEAASEFPRLANPDSAARVTQNNNQRAARHSAARTLSVLPVARAPSRLALRTDPIVAFVGRLGTADGFDVTRKLACRWLKSKHFDLPQNIDDDFEVVSKDGGKAITVRSHDIWALQAETLDPRITGRRWRFELVLLRDEPAEPALGYVLYAVGPADALPPAPTIPRLAGDLIDKVGLYDLKDGSQLSTVPEHVESAAEVDGLVDRLQSPQRQRPIIVLSSYRKDDQIKTLLDPDTLARKLRGLAHVVVLGLEQRASWTLTDRLSKRFSVFGPTVRLFRPRFTTEDISTRHPYWTPQILEQTGSTLPWLQDELLRECAAASVRLLQNEDEIPAFDTVRTMVWKRRIDQIESKVVKLTDAVAYKARIRELERALAESRGLENLAFEETEKLKSDLREVADERDDLSSKNIYLQHRVKKQEQQLGSVAADETVTFPDSWEHLEQWADDHLQDRVVLTTKAIQAARRSKFENVSFAYEVLKFLADAYVPSKRGELEGGIDALNAEKLRLRVDISPVGDAAATHRFKHTYAARYKNREIPLDMHVKGNSDREPRYGFRLYFYWDASEKCVVVGSFPEHLDNGLS